MLCPVCRQPMVIVEFEQIELDACPDCRGVWFDAQELHQLFELVGAPENVYELESQLERMPRAAGRRACPRCRGSMDPVRAPRGERELILDQCARGHGLWFDQGELESLFESLLGDESAALLEVRRYLGQFIARREGGEATS